MSACFSVSCRRHCQTESQRIADLACRTLPPSCARRARLHVAAGIGIRAGLGVRLESHKHRTRKQSRRHRQEAPTSFLSGAIDQKLGTRNAKIKQKPLPATFSHVCSIIGRFVQAGHNRRLFCILSIAHPPHLASRPYYSLVTLTRDDQLSSRHASHNASHFMYSTYPFEMHSPADCTML